MFAGIARMLRLMWLGLGFCLMAWGASAQVGSPAALAPADIDAFVRKAMAQVGVVPGLAISVVVDDRTILSKGYGITDVETRRPVDEHTAFYIASSTKSFTALAIAAMSAKGRFEMDRPVASWIGASALPAGLPAELANEVMLTDLLSHQSGIANEPMGYRAAFTGDYTRASMQALLSGSIANAEAPHGTFSYTNVGYNIATTLIDARFGLDWRDLDVREVLEPAGMPETTPWVSRAGDEVAWGHVPGVAGAMAKSPLQKSDATMQSAGGLMSSASDMARWLRIQLNDGVIDGVRIFPEGLVASTHRSRVPQTAAYGAYTRDGYGLGWQTGRYGEDVLIHHFGNFAGSRAHVSFMPERRIGVAVLANEDLVAGELVDLIANYVYDLGRGRPDLAAHYDEELAALVVRRDKRLESLAASRAQRAARPWPLAAPLDSYAGIYANSEMGELVITREGDGLAVRSGPMFAIAEAGGDPESIRVELVPLQGQTIQFKAPGSLVLSGRTYVRK